MMLQRTQLKSSYLYRTFYWMLVVGLIFQMSKVGFSQILFESFKPMENKSLKGFVFQTLYDISYFPCYKACDESEVAQCFSINFYPSKGVCELNYASDWLKPSYMADDYESTYLSNLPLQEDLAKYGSVIPPDQILPVQKNCKVLKESFPQALSGNYWLNIKERLDRNYWLNIEEMLDPFLGYCDMDTEGGGWTLVWSFTFSMYASFTSGANYVKPVPKNMYSTALEQSNSLPRNETDMNAIDFLYWKEVGAEFLIKSNINNWVACVPGAGSLVTNTVGSLNCRFVKTVVTSPCTIWPGKLVNQKHGIALLGHTTGRMMYYFENSKETNWPTHDPCANNTAKHMRRDAVNPHTNIYIRAIGSPALP